MDNQNPSEKKKGEFQPLLQGQTEQNIAFLNRNPQVKVYFRGLSVFLI